ncbi:WD40 repeat-like protein [Gonapodya prolifera JEL478]|uniref:WD40 repeat-like protein n=1 Tax=Gonapodya prolifera (strain JEL478) TaxID=1344416 RepID=A0A139AEX0_GONPJ|nr:WD40 repeat-like protein [Gonapodya prolifera JEL478]|eukprot:KXS15327.1 WD40 repeat-like protein [Gonapodya prolifera JEL478]
MKKFLPSSSSSTILRRASSRIYCGQFTPSGNLFYCAGQDWTLHVFDSRDPLKMQHLADIPCVRGQWTVTDATADQEGRWLAYASITPVVYLTPTGDSESNFSPPIKGGLGSRQVALDFDPAQSLNFGLWSVRFSADARELVAGASDGNIFVYDIERKEVLLRIDGHDEDVNAVCFADESTNVLFSGSDDSFVKVWDRRSLRSNRPSGVLMGHTEGITYVDTKGDGRYLLSTAKDQTSKLFDVRRMYDADDFQRRWNTRQGKTQLDKRLDWDYRYMAYPGPPTHRHPEDRSVQTYRGHKVLKTLIRSRFTPSSYTGQGYVYAGSADGKVRFYDVLSGECVNTVDVQSVVKSNPELSEHTTGHGRYLWGRRSRGGECVTRDVTMHPHLPVLVTTSWCKLLS